MTDMTKNRALLDELAQAWMRQTWTDTSWDELDEIDQMLRRLDVTWAADAVQAHIERARADILREMADEADMAIDDEMQPEYPGREVAKWLRRRADRIARGSVAVDE